ncbi:Druantia anti-phage system protein DruA [Longimicrobium sp.]|uniref:Druantia anti-phage system protein DruA n=1 Tax=Longimicrobium sp. TaxID=2029185 RepID=UPI003B3BD1C8
MSWLMLRPRALEDTLGRRAVCACVQALESASTAAAVAAVRERLTSELETDDPSLGLHTRIAIGVLCDLKAQGWTFQLQDGHIAAAPPPVESGPADAQKARVREGHRIERDVQLAQRATASFLQSMERKRRGPRGDWVSIFSLMRDGAALERAIACASACPAGTQRDSALAALIQPYVQVVRRGEPCVHTGLDLSHIWRYFRHTWTTTYQSTPGRHLAFLVRDAAAPHHPVIGIAALGSSIVQLGVRDEWIGWAPDAFLRRISEELDDSWAAWLDESLRALIGEILIEDFVDEGLLALEDLVHPRHETIEALREAGVEARRVHRLFPQRDRHKRQAVGESVDWEARARTRLFRSKRALALADLLEIRADLHDLGFAEPSAEALRATLASGQGRRAIKGVLRRMKARQVGVGMMDLTVCGAIAPYNAILGGKLVALMMASSEVVAAYRRAYRASESVIASSIAGRPVVREPNLVLLGTTSLYGVASSQYNRIRMPATVAGGRQGTELRYHRVGRTAGFGSYHFSQETVEVMDLLLAKTSKGREVNSIFGEGVNPKLRKVRAALTVAGFPADLLVQHGQSRLVYMVPLAENFREVLVGRDREPRYLLPQSAEVAPRIAEFWRCRWLSSRVLQEQVRNEVGRHILSYPVRHGAQVHVPGEEDEDLFAEAAAP